MEKEIRVLILEDNPSDMELIKYHLKKNKLNLSVIETKHKTEFITAIENNLPDLVLSDFSLPDMNGEEALKIIREKDQDIPFILVSANIGEEKAVELMRNGANDFVMKDKLKRLTPAIERELKEYDNRIIAKKDHLELLKSKKEITSQKDFYVSILENITNGVWVTDEKDVIIYSNEEMVHIAGVPKNKIIGRSVLDGFEDETLTEFKKVYTKVKDTLFQSEYEIRVVTPSGKDSFQRGWLIPFITDNNFTGMICTAEDVTEKIKFQIKYDKNREQLENIVSNIPGIVYRCLNDSNWTMLYMSEYCEELTGYSKDDFLHNQLISYNDLILEEDRAFVKETIENAVYHNTHFEIEYRIICKDNSIKWVWEKGKYLHNPIKKEESVLEGLILDITELKKSQHELERSNKELEEFAYIASHDLQEPLRMVSSFNQLLDNKYSDKLDDEAKKYINFAIDGAKRMQNLILGLLEYSRVSSKEKNVETFNLDEAVNTAKNNLALRISETKAEFNTDKLPKVKADKNQIVALFQNLLQNSMKFRTLEINPLINISSKYLKNIDQWEITVEDNGIGIDEKYLEKIFVIFNRLHNQKEYTGTGIGLSVCKRIV
ncbi:MAG: PAS domain S-box protein, partial [Candidatus Delongbacteria bacterium]|nr:PAS domain S-box protein [Candidatus Delongbacteria bacterium]